MSQASPSVTVGVVRDGTTPPSSSSYVLYVDDQNHPLPLVECYHATASRSICTTIPHRYPNTALSFVESYYCSQCFRYYDSVQGSTQQNGCCPFCYQCPFCYSLVTVQYDDTATQGGTEFECFYQCQNCDWTSKKDCQSLSIKLFLSQTHTAADPSISDAKSTDATLTKFEALIDTATERLKNLLHQRLFERQQSTDLYFANLLEQWKIYYQQQSVKEPSKISSSNILFSQKPRVDEQLGHEKWSLQLLETKLNRTYKHLHDPSLGMESNSPISRKHISIQDLLLNENFIGIHQPTQDEEWDQMSLFSYQLQQLVNPSVRTARSCMINRTPDDSVDNIDYYYNCWYPISKPFEIRHSYRSKAEVLLYNRPGIILKPKLNPLDGDSSVPFGPYGQWFRKDSSAMYVIPKIQIIQQKHFSNDNVDKPTATISTQHSFLLQVTNPTLGAIRFRFVSSSYQGEWDCWNDEETTNTTTSIVRHLLVDTFHQTILDSVQVLTSFHPMVPSSTVELFPAEDMLLESSSMTTSVHSPTSVPAAVRDWDPRSTTEEHYLRWIGHNAATAWLEVTTTTPETAMLPSSYGLPIALEIELGDGSWESSLIPIQKDKDTVTFDVVLVWTL